MFQFSLENLNYLQERHLSACRMRFLKGSRRRGTLLSATSCAHFYFLIYKMGIKWNDYHGAAVENE